MSIVAQVRGSGTPVVLIHGFTIDHRMMLPLDSLFVADAHEWQRHYIDLPGHGLSPRLPSMTSTALVDAVSDYVTTTIGDAHFGLVGTSLGGWVARSIHVRHESRVLGSALLAPAVRVATNRTVYSGGPVAHDGFEHDVPESDRCALDDFRQVSPLHTRESFRQFVQHVHPGLSAHDTDAAAELMDNYHLEPYPESFAAAEIGGINLTVTGKQDSTVGWRDQLDIVDFYRHHTFAAIESAGHNVHLDQPAISGALISAWLTEIARTER